MGKRIIYYSFFILGLLLLSITLPSPAQRKQVYVIEVGDAITPAATEYIRKSIDRATQDRAECLVIQLDTPGELASHFGAER